MDTLPENTPQDWLKILEESEAEIASGLIVSGDEVMRSLHESLARLKEKQARNETKPVK